MEAEQCYTKCLKEGTFEAYHKVGAPEHCEGKEVRPPQPTRKIPMDGTRHLHQTKPLRARST